MKKTVDIVEVDSVDIAEIDSVDIAEKKIAETAEKKIAETAEREIAEIAEKKIVKIVEKKIVETAEIVEEFVAESKTVVEIDLSDFLHQMKSLLKRSALMQILHSFYSFFYYSCRQ